MLRPINKPCTPGQVRTYEWIRDYIDKNGFAPSVNEIAKARGMSTTAVLHQLVALERRGYIRRQFRIPRSLVICKPLEETSETAV